MIYSKNVSKYGYLKGVAIRDELCIGDFIPAAEPVTRDDLHIISKPYISKGLCFQSILLFKDGFKSVIEVRAQDAANSPELLECLDEKDRITVFNLSKICIENRTDNQPKQLFDSYQEAKAAAPDMEFLGNDETTGGLRLRSHNISMWDDKWCIQQSVGVHIQY